MKKLGLSLVLLAVFALLPLAAFEGEDLKTYPEGIKAGTPLFNIGASFRRPYGGDFIIPPLSFSADFGVPIGGLPFTVGAIVSFATAKDGADDSSPVIGVNARIAYHLNWAIPKLDTYVNLGFGYTHPNGGWPDFNFALGARYFFVPAVGVFAELGGSTYITGGLTVKL
jgi:hypothetical protein